MVEVIPAIIPKNLNIVRESLQKVLGAVRKIQIDIVDGKYAPVVTWPFNDQSDELIKMVRGEEKFPYVDDFKIEIDMLVLHPIEYLSDFISIGAKSFIVYIDSTDHMKECIDTIKGAGLEFGIGIRPSGNFEMVESYLPQIDFVQFMGNDRVGYNGVGLDLSILYKIKKIHDHHPTMPLQIDIGVNFETAPLLAEVGISRFISGSTVFAAPDPREAIRKLQNI